MNKPLAHMSAVRGKRKTYANTGEAAGAIGQPIRNPSALDIPRRIILFIFFLGIPSLNGSTFCREFATTESPEFKRSID